jgi:AcrR family transcriptional regulator
VEKQPRADARRNRELILSAAREAFAAVGPSVPLDEIARRAGVGPGTLHRHFPTKDELLTSVMADRFRALTEIARQMTDDPAPGEAFFAFFYRLVEEVRPNRALSAALSTHPPQSESLLRAGQALQDALGVLLTRAQQAGAVRDDITAPDLHAIIAGALAMEEGLNARSRGRGLAVVADGLRADRAMAGETGPHHPH